MDWTGLLTLVASLALPLLVGILGGIITAPSIEKWYKTIRKPSWNPPNWLFGPVWASLYILMGVALWLVLSSIHWNSPQAEVPILLFVVQLFFNFLWSAIFFGLRRIGLALAEIILLWVSILLNLLEFYAINPLAGLLLIPYLAWVSLASCLNASVWWLNR